MEDPLNIKLPLDRAVNTATSHICPSYSPNDLLEAYSNFRLHILLKRNKPCTLMNQPAGKVYFCIELKLNNDPFSCYQYTKHTISKS